MPASQAGRRRFESGRPLHSSRACGSDFPQALSLSVYGKKKSAPPVCRFWPCVAPGRVPLPATAGPTSRPGQAGPKPMITWSSVRSGRNRTDRPAVSLSSGMSTTRPEQRDALVEPDHRHRVRRFREPAPRRDADHREGRDAAGAVQRHGFPRALARTLGQNSFGGMASSPTLGAPDRGEPARARLVEEALQRDHPISHGRTGSRARWRCCRRGCGRGPSRAPSTWRAPGLAAQLGDDLARSARRRSRRWDGPWT